MKRLFLLFLIILGLLPSQALAQGNAPTDDPALAKVEQAVRDKVKAKGRADYWIIFGQQADLSAATSIADWAARGEYVVRQLQTAAEHSQQSTLDELAQRHAKFQSFWIVNAIHVAGGDHAVLLGAAKRPEVARIADDRPVQLPPIEKRQSAEAQLAAVAEWNIAKVKAPEVWSTYQDRGQGIVVANIDTGVQFDHPALVAQYRGRLANGQFDHNYNWFDPSKVCGNPSLAPCDNNGHGTHTMGTIVGDDGAGNQIGVAPAAKWIAAKGCEETSCSGSALLASGQWMLAPTNLGGTNPRADLRPHVVSNSWGGDFVDATFKDMVKAWVASGIFPVFSNGNMGPLCQSATTPGGYTETYAVGAFDQYDTIATFSSRGTSMQDGVVKPNIAAPGVDIRSSIPNNSYTLASGTSMAAPHVAGAVALLWSASSALMGDINATRALLDQSAIDTNDTSCGGTAAKNNVWGEGRLDVYAAVTRAARDTKSTLSGAITNTSTGAGILGATIAATGPLPQNDNRTTTSAANGAYSLPLPAGTYNITVSGFGYSAQTITNVPVGPGTTTRNVQLASLPRYSISGTVRDVLGNTLGGVAVGVASTPLPGTTTDANGNYTLTGVPQGAYLLSIQPGHCNESAGLAVTISGNMSGVNFNLSQKMDPFGYTCQTIPTSFVAGSTKLGLSGDDTSQAVPLPFAFRHYGISYTNAYVSANGYLRFKELDPTYSSP
jgi:subtilisin family serine protease